MFRSRKADRLKLLYWDGSGIVMAYKRLEEHSFTLPGIKDGLMTLTHAQFEALFAGLDWRRVHAVQTRTPQAIEQLRHDDSGRQISKAKQAVFYWVPAMLDAADLPDDVAALKAMLIAAQVREAGRDAQIARKDERIERLEKLVAAFKQAAFGRKSEKTDPDQFDLALEDLETAMAAIHAEDEADVPVGNRTTKPRTINRGSLPKHLPRVEEVIEPESLTCGCGGCLHCIGEDVSERLDVVPAQFRVIVTRRPKYACRACTDGVVQAPAPARLIQAGLPTEATVAHVLVSKYADHLPLYRQAQIMSRQGIDLDRSTLADRVGRAAFELRPVFDVLIADLKRSSKLFMDETRAPVPDPGSRKTKTGYFWALARGHDAGAENWAMIASRVETCKLNAVDPVAYPAATLTAIVNGHRQSRIAELLPWNHSILEHAKRQQ